MLETDLHKIGNKLLYYRKSLGMTQFEVAEATEISDRAYANIERGNVYMRLDTLLRICSVLKITPNDILLRDEDEMIPDQEEVLDRLNACSGVNKRTALQLLQIYLRSLEH